MDSVYVSIQEVIDSFINLLQKAFPNNLVKFQNLLSSNPESAHSEALVFALLHNLNLCPEIWEDPSKGGVDFLCLPKKYDDFVVEATSLSHDSVAEQSGMPNTYHGSGGSFKLITNILRRTIGDKAPQMAGYQNARLLIITSAHKYSHILLGTHSAENLIYSDTMIQVPIGNLNGKEILSTDLRNSAFIKPKNDTIVSCRQSVSAILLIAITEIYSSIVGILPLEPAKPFDISCFPKIPFLSLKFMPSPGGEVQLKWVGREIEWDGDKPRPAIYYHLPI
jgi:hypothetical protein